MPADIFPHTTPELSAARKKLTPDIHDAFTAFSERVFSEGALPVKTKQLIGKRSRNHVFPASRARPEMPAQSVGVDGLD
jgi:hypothetical protein